MERFTKPVWFLTSFIFGGIIWYLSQNPLIAVTVAIGFLVPSFIAVYVPYAKKNPCRYWFKRRLYGWGWTPVTWQGWAVTLIYLVLVVALSHGIDDHSSGVDMALRFAVPFAVLTAGFILIAYKKGEKPMWQWGERK